MSNLQIITALRGTSTDITDAPATTGTDAWTGFGLVNTYVASGIPIASVSTPSPGGTYEAGTIHLEVTFAAPVNVSGIPTIMLNTVPPRTATYVSGSGTSTLIFYYTIVQGDQSTNLAPASLQALTQGGGSMTDNTSFANPVDTALPASVGDLDQPMPFSPGSQINIDAVGPTVVISGSPLLSNQSASLFTITLSHAVTSFGMSNLSLSSNATSGNLRIISVGLVYQLAVTAITPGPVILTVPANTAVDAYGYGNSEGHGSITYDITPPTLTISAPAISLTAGQDLNVTFTFSKSVTGFGSENVGIAGGSAVGVMSGSGAIYTEVVTSSTAGTMSITVPAGSATDQAGNALAAPASLTVTVVNASTSSSKNCGLGSGFGLIFGHGLWWWKRRPSNQKMNIHR